MKKLDILYEDKYIIVVNKPCKVLTIKDKKGDKNLYEEVSSYVKRQNPHNKIFIVHRLDKDTSGIVLFAKSEKIKHYFQDHWDSVKREYLALVENYLPKKKDTLINFLEETKTYLVYVSNKGKKAITSYEVINEYKSTSLIKVSIATGKKNQIRVQLSHIGNPIVGDKKYGAKTNPLNRLSLHANYLKFIHPITHKIIEITSACPFIDKGKEGKK